MNPSDEAVIRAGTRAILNRRQLAYQDFIEVVHNLSQLPVERATKIAASYLQLKIITFDGIAYRVKHGMWLDHATLIHVNGKLDDV